MLNKKVIESSRKYYFQLETITFSISCTILYFINIFFSDSNDSVKKYFIFLILVIIFGLPHGALDSILAKKKSIYKSLYGFLVFNFSYLVIAVITFFLWKFFSVIMLIIFLAISVYHFSEDWKNYVNNYERILFSSGIVLLPTLMYSNEVLNIYFLLTQDNYVNILISNQKIFAYFILLFYLYIFIKKIKNRNFIIQLAFILISSLFLNPIEFFVCYFCFLHSIKNYKDTIKDLNINIFNISMLANTILSIILGFFLYYFYLSGSLDAKILSIIFIGLASLTVPHMILKFYIYQKEKSLFR